MDSPLFSAAINNWLQCLAWLLLKYFLPGLAWSGVLPVERVLKNGGRLSLWAVRVACSLFLGLVLHVLLSLLLAELGLYTPAIEATCTLLLVVSGFIAARKMGTGRIRAHLIDNAPGAVMLALGVVTIMALPRASEWLMGGLDPGVYQNQGIYVERTGTFYPEADPFYSTLSKDELALFSREAGGYREIMPGVPVNIDDGALQHYFFRLTPTLTASISRSGGLRAAVRTNYFAGLFAAVIFWGMLAGGGAGLAFQLFALFFLIVQPIFLYQLHVPTSEMLQLCLILGIGLLLSMRKAGIPVLVFLGMAFFAAVLNRLSFMPFAGMLIFGVAWMDKERKDRRRVWTERLAMLSGLTAGIAFDFLVCGITIKRLWGPMPMMIAFAAATVALAVLLDLISARGDLRVLLRSLPTWLYRLCLAGLFTFLVVLWNFGRNIGLAEASATLHTAAPFLGGWLPILSMAGAAALFWKRRKDLTVIRLMIAFMCGVTLIVLIKSFVEGYYPWSTRRFLAYTVPALAMLAGYSLALTWNARFIDRRLMKICSVMVFSGVLATTARTSWHAFSRVEYQGVSNVLTDIADRIKDGDIVVIDTPTWGTPLKFIYGKNIVNGKHLWRRKDKEGMEQALLALRRFSSDGSRIRFLTTTRTAGMDIYPVRPGNLRLDFESGEVHLEELIQSRRASDFKMRNKPNVFRLYTWEVSSP